LNFGYGRKNSILDVDSKESWPSLSRYCHLDGSVTTSSKEHFSVILSQLSHDTGEHTKFSVNRISLLDFFDYEMSSLVRLNVLCKAVTVVKAFCKPTNGSLREKHYVKGRQIHT
jgi:hypothetical protein